MFFATSCSGGGDSYSTILIADYSVSADTVAFGGVDVGSSQIHTFTVKDTGTLPIAGLTIGDLSNDFTRTTTYIDTLPTGASCNIEVRFAPVTAGDRAASLDISSTHSGAKSIALAARGTAICEIAAVKLLLDYIFKLIVYLYIVYSSVINIMPRENCYGS